MTHTQKIIERTAQYVRQSLSGERSGHDWWHSYRVWKMATYIAKEEKADLFIVQLAALLHDIADWKFYKGDVTVGPKKAQQWLSQQGVNKDTIEHVYTIIKSVSYKGACVRKVPMNTIEGKIVQDADRLDAMGAIGIARTFTFGGYKRRPMWDPDVKPILHHTVEGYLNSQKTGNTINHFYEKLLLLKKRINTKTAKKLAQKRHKIMEDYLRQFYKEWEGEQ